MTTPTALSQEAWRSNRRLIAELTSVLSDDKAAMESAPRVEAEWLLAEALGVSRTELYVWEAPIPPPARQRLAQWLRRRLAGEPLQQVLGSAVFCGHRLFVNSTVFIPRPETEVLADQMIRHLQARALDATARRALSVLDVCTGSGCIAISVAKAVAACVVTALEVSWEALRVAQHNVRRCGVSERVRLIQADLTAGLVGRFDAIVSNPPYVPSANVRLLSAQRLGDPDLSLDGGPDGMSCHRRLLANAPRLLAARGVVCLECAEDQADSLARMAGSQSWARRVRVWDDLAGRPRGIWIETA